MAKTVETGGTGRTAKTAGTAEIGRCDDTVSH